MDNPFDLSNDESYRRWRDEKLAGRPADTADLVVEIGDPGALTPAEFHAASDRIRRINAVLLSFPDSTLINKDALVRLGRRFGLERLDGNLCADEDAVSTIQVKDGRTGGEYIPYTNRALGWHTDGYYNAPDQQIRAWSLMCRQDAREGGENALLDHEILYILLREENPQFIHALSQPDAMTIPANLENGVQIRPAQVGPVFSVNPRDGSLHLRYSARTRNILWKQDPITLAAAKHITGLFSSATTYIYRHRLEPGQCLLSNNVLHNRSAFRDDPGQRRVIYRARYYDRIRI